MVSVLDNPYGVYQYVSRDTAQSVVFIMGQHMHFAQLPDRLCLKALEPEAQYRVTGHGTYYKKPSCPTSLSDSCSSRRVDSIRF